MPTEVCLRKMDAILPSLRNLGQYGIIANDEQRSRGNKISTFYEYTYGKYPYFKNHEDLNSAVNGGIPQVCFPYFPLYFFIFYIFSFGGSVVKWLCASI